VFLCATITWVLGSQGGTDTLPVTRNMITAIQGGMGLILIIVVTYYGGELVWRERERRVHEITDSSAVPDWAFLVPKTLAITLVMLSLMAVGVLTAIVVQTVKGYNDYELDKYLVWYLLPGVLSAFMLTALSVFVQAVSPHKFVGWGVMVLYYISSLVFSNLGWDHNLYNYGATTSVPLSDMNGAGDFGRWAMWFNAYWGAFAIALLVLAYVLWPRGTETRYAPRLARAPRRLLGAPGLIGATALAAFAGLGVWIFINTNVWNEYRSGPSTRKYLADYEKTLLRFEGVPQPAVRDVVLDVELHPHESKVLTAGTYVLENRTAAPLREVHLRRGDRDTRFTTLAVEGARPTKEWERFGYTIFTFDRPMTPGERRTVRFNSEFGQRGFRNSGNMTEVVDNGSFLNHSVISPLVGMTRDGGLQDRAQRRKYGLPAEQRMAKLEDQSARAENYIGADWVNADITVSTVADQTPIAPGYRVSDVTRDGRRTARFVTEAPILHFFSVQSARYAVTRENHRGVELSIYHHPTHDENVGRMLKALRTGLDYYQSAFGPYQFRQARIIEFPAYADFAQAFANTMPYSENLGFIADYRDPEKIDYATYITAHELGHQWWAHQIVGADMQGSTTLSETLAQYSALMVMEKLYGPDRIRRFLKYELDSYLGSRGTEVVEELPLIRVENQGYIHYRKGSLVMYLLKDKMGEERVNAALRRVLNDYRFKSAPYPTSLELVRALRAEAGPEHQALITDLFERITLYDLKTTEATKRKRPDGRWEVSMTVEARKFYADGQGKETETPLNETMDVGVFTTEVGEGDFDRRDVAVFQPQALRSGMQRFTFVVDREPVQVGVDPYNKRIDRESDDNLRKVG
jgi:aminopeptidase N